MLRVGLTGGIGTGKSTVGAILGTLGVPVYYADDEAKKLMNESESIRAQLISVFGTDTYQDGKLNRSYLAARVFGDAEKLELLNSITHPPTIEHANNWMLAFDPAVVPYTVKEAALLFESGSVRHLDFVIGVQSPLPLRIKRIMDRDGISADEVRQRMDRQMDEFIKLKLCDAVVINDEQQLLIPQVLELHARLLALASGIQKKPAG